MKKLIFTLCICFQYMLFAQNADNRLETLKNQLDILAVENGGFSETLKLQSNVNNVSVSNFLMALSKVHNININVDPELNQISIVNSFSNVTVTDLLVFLCKEYNLDIDFTGNILSVKRYIPEQKPPEEKKIIVGYNPATSGLTLNLNNDPLGKVFRAIIDQTGHNLFFSDGMDNTPLNFYIKDLPFDKAMENLATSNNLIFSKSRDGFYYFNQVQNNDNGVSHSGRRGNGFFYTVRDTLKKKIDVDFKNTPVSRIIHELGHDLNIDIYTATPLEQAGSVTFKADGITFDHLLDKIFENTKATPSASYGEHNPNTPGTSRSPANMQPGTNFTYKKEGNIYFFGTEDLLSVRKVEAVVLKYRSVEILGDPSTAMGSARRNSFNTGNYQNFSDYNNYSGTGSSYNNYNTGNRNSTFNNPNRSNNTFSSGNSLPQETNSSSLLDIVPGEIRAGLDIQPDKELNMFIVSGSGTQVERFKKFIEEIDKPVPVVLIEVMFLEVNKSSTVETGISWGIGEEPVKTQGSLFPTTDFTLSAHTVNKVIGGFDGFGSLNLGKVVPEFFVTIKAMEENGDVKILSTPKMSTLNGHRAIFSNSETSYYAVTTQNFLGSQNPITSEITNYFPIDAGMMLSVKPYVSGDGQITLDIFVTQSAFNNTRIADDAPPGINAREFSSIIRMRDQDIAVLGGLEQNLKNNAGEGVPFLSRIPIIKWLFSSRKREASKKKLTVLIKPTVIN